MFALISSGKLGKRHVDLSGVDGTFLKDKIKGQLLVAIGRDSDNVIYPIAWAVVKVENTEN